jgi:hypothetical protein
LRALAGFPERIVKEKHTHGEASALLPFGWARWRCGACLSDCGSVWTPLRRATPSNGDGVKSHNGNRWNEASDALCGDAARGGGDLAMIEQEWGAIPWERFEAF